MVNVIQSRTPVRAPGRTPSYKEEMGLYYRIATPLPSFDPWALAQVVRRPGEPLMQWQQDGFSFAAIGASAEMTFQGPTRFKDADAWSRAFSKRLLGKSADGISPQVPLMVGGFAFQDTIEPELSGPWLGWRSNLLRVPRLVLYKRGDNYGAVATKRLGVAQQPTGRQDKLREELLEALRTLTTNMAEMVKIKAADDGLRRHGYQSQVSAALGELDYQESNLSKVVLARRASYSAAGRISHQGAVNRLRKEHPNCATFLFNDGGGRCFLGATPELLASKSGQGISTRALAGTQRRKAGQADEALLASEKDQREHDYVVQAITDSLKPITVSVHHESNPHLRLLRDVSHLETKIEASLTPGTSLLQAVAQLHPTPAIGGTPREEACKFIAQHETEERGWYTGPIGWIDGQGDGEFHVALRCGVISEKQAWGFAGAGIVEGSCPEAEWDETTSKLRAFRSALGPIQEDA